MRNKLPPTAYRRTSSTIRGTLKRTSGTLSQAISDARSATKVHRRNLDAMVAHLQGNLLPRLTVGFLLLRRQLF